MLEKKLTFFDDYYEKNSWKSQVESAFLSNDKEYVRLISLIVPVYKFLEPNLFSKLQSAGYKEMQQHMIDLGYDPQENELEAFKTGLSREEFSIKMDNKFPILRFYQLPDRSLNEAHKKRYGDVNAQEIYLDDSKRSMKKALDWLDSFDTESSFVQLVEELALDRHVTAIKCGSKDSSTFGAHVEASTELVKLASDSDIMVPDTSSMTSLYNNHYSSYQPRLEAIKDSYVAITIDSKEYILTKYIEDLALSHHFTEFWVKDNPVALEMTSRYKSIASKDYSNIEDLHRDIAAFHYYFANIVPVKRGTASLAESLTDALWLYHGYLPGKMKSNESIDLEAQTSPGSKFETSFLPKYPFPTGKFDSQSNQVVLLK